MNPASSREPGHRMPRITAGKDAANLLVPVGSWAYRLRCGGSGASVATGRLTVMRDKGTRPLPTAPPTYPIDADGRTYRVDYQSQIPSSRPPFLITTLSAMITPVA